MTYTMFNTLLPHRVTVYTKILIITTYLITVIVTTCTTNVNRKIKNRYYIYLFNHKRITFHNQSQDTVKQQTRRYLFYQIRLNKSSQHEGKTY